MWVLGNQDSGKSSIPEVRSHHILSMLFDGFGRISFVVISCLEAPALLVTRRPLVCYPRGLSTRHLLWDIDSTTRQ